MLRGALHTLYDVCIARSARRFGSVNGELFMYSIASLPKYCYLLFLVCAAMGPSSVCVKDK